MTQENGTESNHYKTNCIGTQSVIWNPLFILVHLLYIYSIEGYALKPNNYEDPYIDNKDEDINGKGATLEWGLIERRLFWLANETTGRYYCTWPNNGQVRCKVETGNRCQPLSIHSCEISEKLETQRARKLHMYIVNRWDPAYNHNCRKGNYNHLTSLIIGKCRHP